MMWIKTFAALAAAREPAGDRKPGGRERGER